MCTELINIKNKIRNSLTELYTKDQILFERNNEEGVQERCIQFRFAMYLQNQFDNYYVDVEYDNTITCYLDDNGFVTQVEESKKKLISDEDGNQHLKVPDIIIHKRGIGQNSNYLCFELKKWNRTNNRLDVKKDHDVLKFLTSIYEFGYLYGFHIIFGRVKDETKWTIFQNGQILEEVHVF
ncbi:hypothetical protein [uncultured Methanolobus sp.]|uniref:hypothetical protein n=1 Tax=uncultured Methanolobus sp. TaxID=218300 RepID=UPI002AAA8C07|nr:hypothetical protein [uncultured Methanolobus sp.]